MKALRAESGSVKHTSRDHSLVDYSTEHAVSSLLLHVSAAADYFSTNTTLMQDGLLVDLDISKLQVAP